MNDPTTPEAWMILIVDRRTLGAPAFAVARRYKADPARTIRRTMKIHRERCYATAPEAEALAERLNRLEPRFLFVATAIVGSDWRRTGGAGLHRIRFESTSGLEALDVLGL
jgi:hypothetical protein